MPRCPVSTVFSASNASSVFGAANGSLSPLTRISACIIAPLLRRPRRQKTFETERPDRRLDDIVENEPRHGVRCHRRQQNAVAVMAGGIEQAVERPGPEDRRVVATAR